MIRLKTAVLLAASLKIGALSANADNNSCNNIYQLGINLGIAFQLQDDLLDAYGDTANFQKKLGGDIVANKKTYLLINALTLANEKTKKELLYWLNLKTFDRQQKINAVKNIFDDLNIQKRCEDFINNSFAAVDEHIEKLNVDEKRTENLMSFINFLRKRNY
jgi:geranylgeranyl diphosphate synthase type II